jgi:hypothetical protein
VTGPAAWFVRIAGVNGIVGPLGFGGFTIPAIVSVAQGHGILYTFGNPTYGDGPPRRKTRRRLRLESCYGKRLGV